MTIYQVSAFLSKLNVQNDDDCFFQYSYNGVFSLGHSSLNITTLWFFLKD